MSTQVRQWLDNAILQSVAESYLNLWTDLGGPLSLEKILQQGVNHPILNESGTGATRLTDTQITWFEANYDIITHYPDDSSGFSATLFRNKSTGEYTLSFRSTEYQLAGLGGDYERDGSTAADGEISEKGYALAQLSSMETFYANLKQGKVYDTANHVWVNSTDPRVLAFKTGVPPLNVTGYSLGAQMASAFTLMHELEVQQAYTYNAAGLGGYLGAGLLPAAPAGYRTKGVSFDYFFEMESTLKNKSKLTPLILL
jgi:hypothetical protein